jgi:hypothetical protein
MKPKKSEIIAPEGGWADQSYYEVEVSVCETNPIFNAILYTGFVDKERPDLPGGYSFIMSPGMGGSYRPVPKKRQVPQGVPIPFHEGENRQHLQAPRRRKCHQVENHFSQLNHPRTQ